MWGKQHHDIGSSILSQTPFWDLLRQDWRSWTSDFFLRYCRESHIGQCHIYDTPDVVVRHAWSSSFADQNVFCCLIFLICRDLLHQSLCLRASAYSSTADLREVIRQRFSRVIPAHCQPMTMTGLAVWYNIFKHGSKDCSFLIEPPAEGSRFLYSKHASMVSQFCHAALHGAVHAKPRKTGFPNDMSHGKVLNSPPVLFSKCCVMGNCALLEMRKPENYVGYWHVEWGGNDRSTLMMGFMDIILLEVEATLPSIAGSSPCVRFVYGAFIQDDHGKNKTGQHHRDSVRAITFSCARDDTEFCCEPREVGNALAFADYRIISITALRTSGQFKATQRWHTASLIETGAVGC